MPSSLQGWESRRVARGVRVLVVVFATGCGLVGCAGSGERLPQCTGKPVPINSLIPAVATATAGATATVRPGTAAERLDAAREEGVNHAH